MSGQRFRYKAFISYSHRDASVAQWLHRALESYRAPRHLIGQQTATGTIERRIGAIFRDRDELPVASDLSGQINDALAATQFLIVLCSTASAKSKWVNQEVINFKRMKGAGSIIAVIVDGEPYASDVTGRENEECFAPALRYQVTDGGQITDQPAEPIAADLRDGKDGKRMVKLKVLAGLMGVGLDALVQREAQRRQRFMTAVTFASLAGIGIMGALTFNAIEARNEAEVAQGNAERRRNEAEGLIEFMLSDLQVPLREIGRLKEFNNVSEKVTQYYANEDLAKLPDDSVGRRARAFHLVGESKLLSKNYKEAEPHLRNAESATGQLLNRDPQNVQRLYEHGQSQFWLGLLYFNDGRFEDSAQHLKAYIELADRITAIEPSSRPRRTDAARARNSLAAIYLKSGQPQAAIRLFTESEEILTKLLLENPVDQLKQELSNLLVGRADALRMIGQLEAAIIEQRKSQQINAELSDARPNDQDAQFRRAISERRLGRLMYELGRRSDAQPHLVKALQLSERLLTHDSQARLWQDEYFANYVDLATANWSNGELSSREASALDKKLTSLVSANDREQPPPINLYWQSHLAALFLQAHIAKSQGDNTRATAKLKEVNIILDRVSARDPNASNLATARAEALINTALIAANNQTEKISALRLAAVEIARIPQPHDPSAIYFASFIECEMGQPKENFKKLKAWKFVSPLSVLSESVTSTCSQHQAQEAYR